MQPRTIKFRAWDVPNSKLVSQEYLNSHRSGFRLLDSEEFQFEQFTGLLDKNGKEIYEGDILRGCFRPEDEATTDNVVTWSPTTTGFSPLNEYDSDCDTAYDIDTCEVIGNIHENPELLETLNT